MKRFRFATALLGLVMALVLGLAAGPADSSAAEEAAKCTCAYPNSGKVGVKENDDCKVVDCWVDMEVE